MGLYFHFAASLDWMCCIYKLIAFSSFLRLFSSNLWSFTNFLATSFASSPLYTIRRCTLFLPRFTSKYKMGCSFFKLNWLSLPGDPCAFTSLDMVVYLFP